VDAFQCTCGKGGGGEKDKADGEGGASGDHRHDDPIRLKAGLGVSIKILSDLSINCALSILAVSSSPLVIGAPSLSYRLGSASVRNLTQAFFNIYTRSSRRESLRGVVRRKVGDEYEWVHEYERAIDHWEGRQRQKQSTDDDVYCQKQSTDIW
jgi:hypothetical protein